jgi:hypothetical protein
MLIEVIYTDTHLQRIEHFMHSTGLLQDAKLQYHEIIECTDTTVNRVQVIEAIKKAYAGKRIIKSIK